MKNENIFETDSPTVEMEARTLRPTQHGHHVPFVNGISINPYTGAAIHAAYAPYSQHPGYVNFNGFPGQQQMTPQYFNPVAYQPQSPVQNGNNYVNPAMVGSSQGYFGNAFPTPYIPNQFQGNVVNPFSPAMQAPWFGTPFTQPTQGQFPGIPATQPNFGAFNPLQPSPYYQPAINIVDGQYMLLPNQPTEAATRNGSALPKNGERDFTSWFPNVNILETDRSFKIEICIPGVAKENCRISIDKNNILRVTGTRRWNQESEAVGFTRKEFNYGSFACSFVLTENLHKEKISSSCRNGLLIVSIPKRDGTEGEDRSFSDISVN